MIFIILSETDLEQLFKNMAKELGYSYWKTSEIDKEEEDQQQQQSEVNKKLYDKLLELQNTITRHLIPFMEQQELTNKNMQEMFVNSFNIHENKIKRFESRFETLYNDLGIGNDDDMEKEIISTVEYDNYDSSNIIIDEAGGGKGENDTTGSINELIDVKAKKSAIPLDDDLVVVVDDDFIVSSSSSSSDKDVEEDEGDNHR